MLITHVIQNSTICRVSVTFPWTGDSFCFKALSTVECFSTRSFYRSYLIDSLLALHCHSKSMVLSLTLTAFSLCTRHVEFISSTKYFTLNNRKDNRYHKTGSIVYFTILLVLGFERFKRKNPLISILQTMTTKYVNIYMALYSIAVNFIRMVKHESITNKNFAMRMLRKRVMH